jgi:hypothetical protein
VDRFQFWNEPNGCSWVNDGCSNGDQYALYTLWLQRAYTALKEGNPNCIVAAGALDYNEGVTQGWQYIQGMYQSGAKGYFDAISIHPYASTGIYWQALEDTRNVMVAWGDGDKPIWLTEYGWNEGTTNDTYKASQITNVLTTLKSETYDYVEMANYLCITDLPDDGNPDYGLCNRDLSQRPSWYAFQAVDKTWPVTPTPTPSPTVGSPTPTPTAPPQGSNLLLNPGAELNSFQYWTTGTNRVGQPRLDPDTYIPSPPNHSGSHRFGMAVGWDTVDCFMYQTVNVLPGHTYEAGFWIVKQDGTDETFEMSWVDGAFGGTENTLYFVPDSTVISNWQQYAGAQFVPTGNTATLVIRFAHTLASNIATMHLDDISLVELSVDTPTPAPPTSTTTPAPPTPTSTPVPPTSTPTVTPTVDPAQELLTNPGFEADGTDFVNPPAAWGIVHTNEAWDGTLAADSWGGNITTPPRSGIFCAGKVTNWGAPQLYYYQEVSVSPGLKYDCSAYVHTPVTTTPENPGQVRVGVDPNGGTDPFSADVVWTAGTTSTAGYSLLGLTGGSAVTATGTTLTLFLEARTLASDWWNGMLFDDASVKRSVPTTPTPTVPATGTPTDTVPPPTSTGTPTSTSTPVPTATETLPPTAPPTSNPTSSATPTATPTDTTAPTSTPTATPTETATPVPTTTPTETPGTFPDRDGDGIADGLEGGLYPPAEKTNGYLADSDGDGLDDGVEDANRNGVRDPGELDPRDRDSDGDGYEDGVEVLILGSDALSSADPGGTAVDADCDGLPAELDGDDLDPDQDKDGFIDGYEAVTLDPAAVSDPNRKPVLGDADGNGTRDAADAVLILNFFSDLPAGGILPGRCDLDRNGVIDNADAQISLNYSGGTQPELPAER